MWPPALGAELGLWAPAWSWGWSGAELQQCRVGALHGPAALSAGPAWPKAFGASAAWPCSAVCRFCMALQHHMQVQHGLAASHASRAWLCSTARRPCTALQHYLQVLHGPQCRLEVLHGSAVLHAGPAQSFSITCGSCTALQYHMQVLHNPAALAAGTAWLCSTECKCCMALQCQV